MFKQDADHNCGVWASMYLISIMPDFYDYFGYEFKDISPGTPRELEKIAGTTEELGTKWEGIEKIFAHYGIPTTLYKNSTIEELKSNLPSLVNYQTEEDGILYPHFGVALRIRAVPMVNATTFESSGTLPFVELFDPACGQEVLIPVPEFESRWWSKLNGPRAFLTLGGPDLPEGELANE